MKKPAQRKPKEKVVVTREKGKGLKVTLKFDLAKMAVDPGVFFVEMLSFLRNVLPEDLIMEFAPKVAALSVAKEQ